MTSACILKDILRNHTQIFLEFKIFFLRFVYISFNFNCTLDFLPAIDAEQRRGNIKQIPLQASAVVLPAVLITLPFSFFDISYRLHQFIILISKMTSNISMASNDSDVFYVEQNSSEISPQRNKTPNILNSTEISEQHTARMPSIFSIASPEPRIFTIDGILQ